MIIRPLLLITYIHISFAIGVKRNLQRNPRNEEGEDIFRFFQQVPHPFGKTHPFEHLQLSPESMQSLAILTSMFQNPVAVQHALPPGIPAATPDRLVDLIASAFAQTSNLDKPKLERMLKVWRTQLTNSPQFFQHPEINSNSAPNAIPTETTLQKPIPSWASIDRAGLETTKDDVTDSGKGGEGSGSNRAFSSYTFPQLPQIYPSLPQF